MRAVAPGSSLRSQLPEAPALNPSTQRDADGSTGRSSQAAGQSQPGARPHQGQQLSSRRVLAALGLLKTRRSAGSPRGPRCRSPSTQIRTRTDLAWLLPRPAGWCLPGGRQERAGGQPGRAWRQEGAPTFAPVPSRAGRGALTWSQQGDAAAAAASAGELAVQAVRGRHPAQPVQGGVADPDHVQVVLVDVKEFLKEIAQRGGEHMWWQQQFLAMDPSSGGCPAFPATRQPPRVRGELGHQHVLGSSKVEASA